MPIGVNAPSDVTASYPAWLVTANIGRPLMSHQCLIRLDEVRVVNVELNAPGCGRIRHLLFDLIAHRNVNVARYHVRTLAHNPVPGRATTQPGLAVLAQVL